MIPIPSTNDCDLSSGSPCADDWKASAPLVELAWELEQYLGPSYDPKGLVSIPAAVRNDEEERFPYQAIGYLQGWGLQKYCLPRDYGGRAGDVEVGFTLLRLVARRDPTTAISLMLTNLAYMPVWIAGTTAQKEVYTSRILNGGRFAWGLSEAAHGSDILANQTRAVKVEGGWEISGGKDYIGNATVADMLVVQAKTGQRPGPASTSVFAVDKLNVPAGSIIQMPRSRLNGIRAKDLGGFRLDKLFVPDEALIGSEGQGLEIALKSAQVARATITSVSLGLVDTALRSALDFAVERHIFGGAVIDVPYTRRRLLGVFADLLLGESTCTAAVRGLQGNPDQISVTSSIAKFLIPTAASRTLDEVAMIIGARGYLRDDPRYGHLGKALRDNMVAIFADGNTVVNLKVIASQLSPLLARGADGVPSEPETLRLKSVFSLSAELPKWRPDKQELSSRTGDDAVTFLGHSIRELRRRASDNPGPLNVACDLAAWFVDELDRMRERLDILTKEHGRNLGSSADILDLAERFSRIHSAAATVAVTAWSFDELEPQFRDGTVLCLALWRARSALDSRCDPLPQEIEDAGMEILLGLHRRSMLFSFRPLHLL